MSAPGTWPPRDVWTRLWEDWYILEIAETPLSVRSLRGGVGGLRGRGKLPAREAPPLSQDTDSGEDAGPQGLQA